MTTQARVPASLIFFAACLAFLVILLGVYTRVTDAGLACPDWPGCYHQLLAPNNATDIKKDLIKFPQANIQISKVWTEMIHRYVAGILALLISIQGLLTIQRRKVPGQPLFVPGFLLLLVLIQVILGMLTVTKKLEPTIVMTHLLFGITILSLLWLLFLMLLREKNNKIVMPKLKPWLIFGLVLVVGQIILGGWTSANYAGLICSKFPGCEINAFFPKNNFSEAFNIFNPSSMLSEAALITIQITHRIGALVVTVYIGFLSLYLILAGKAGIFVKLGFFIFFLLITQISLGMLNVMFRLPTTIAVMHNGVAVLILLSLVTLNYLVFSRDTSK